MISPLINGTLQGHIHNKGGKYITNTDAYTGEFIAIFAHTATVIDDLICSGLAAGTIDAIDVPAGATYQFPGGGATSVKLTSGKATLYYA